MWIFGPLPCSTISPVTVTLASAAASLVTVSPSTSRIAGRATVSPAAPWRRLIVNVSPTATLCWLPPAFTTAYTTDSSLLFVSSCCVPARRPERSPGAGRAAFAGPGGTLRRPHGGGATRPAYLMKDPVLLPPRELGASLGTGPRRRAGPPGGSRPADGAAGSAAAPPRPRSPRRP